MEKFKPFKQEKDIISIRIDSDLLEKIDKCSFDAKISRNKFIIQCIEYAIKNMKAD